MADLAEIVTEVNRPEIALALDTGHANLTSNLDHETRAVRSLLLTTHVHDNNGQSDSHHPPGQGTIDWADWVNALDDVGYSGPIMLECIRHLREHPESMDDRLFEILHYLSEA
jgi:sugar phosphate isomerase/epimerase